MGTPSRPYRCKAAVMEGSRRVQSATRKATFLWRKAFWTSGRDRVTRSFTWQVRHQAAVKSIKTVRPVVSWRVTSSSDQGIRPEWGTAISEVAAFRNRAGKSIEARRRSSPVP